MTKTKSILNYLVYNSVFSTCLYFGAIQGISGFMNILTFYIWFAFILFIFGCFNQEAQIRVYESEKNRLKLGIFGHMITAAYVGILVYYGHILLGSIYLITVFLGYCMVASGKKLVELVETNQRDKIEDYVKSVFPDKYVCLLGAKNLKIEWVKKGTQFRIKEYDGYEGIVFHNDDYWNVAW